MDNERFYRINIRFPEPNKLNQGFRSRFQKELNNQVIFLGIRFNPTNFNRSAGINSLELANQCMNLAKILLVKDYGEINCLLREFTCSSSFMRSMIDTDSRTLTNYIQNLPSQTLIKNKAAYKTAYI